MHGSHPALAQRSQERDSQAWVEYQSRRGFGDNLIGSWSAGYRKLATSQDTLGEWARVHLRSDVTYFYSRRLSFEGGAGVYNTFGDSRFERFEFRTWQGALLEWPEPALFGRTIPLQHRLRLEERWLRAGGSDSSTSFGFRLRYRLQAVFPIGGSEIDVKSLYVPVMGEWFGDLGGETPELFAAQARLTAGVGYLFTEHWGLELRYTIQRSRDTILDELRTTDHVLDVRVRTSFRMKDPAEPW